MDKLTTEEQPCSDASARLFFFAPVFAEILAGAYYFAALWRKLWVVMAMEPEMDLKQTALQLARTGARRFRLQFFFECAVLAAWTLGVIFLRRADGGAPVGTALLLLGGNAAILAVFAAANAALFWSAAGGPTQKNRRCFLRGVLLRGVLLLLRGALFALAVLPTCGLLCVAAALLSRGVSVRGAVVLCAGVICMMAVSVVAGLHFSSLLFLAPYYCASGCPPGESIRRSVAVMGRQQRLFFSFRRSYYGWFLLCLFLLPLPFVWRYYQQSAALFAAAVIEAEA